MGPGKSRAEAKVLYFNNDKSGISKVDYKTLVRRQTAKRYDPPATGVIAEGVAVVIEFGER